MTHSVSARFLKIAFSVALGSLLAGQLALAQTTPTFSALMYFNGSRPAAGLAVGADGALYGVGLESTFGTGATAGLIYRLAPDASKIDTIYQYGLKGAYTGGGPRGILARDATGNLYGITAYNRLDPTSGVAIGAGTIFRISPDGNVYTQLHVFPDSIDTAAPFHNSDGISPLGSILLASDGFLYGTTTIGGLYGQGTIFKIRTDGTGFTAIHHFDLSTTTNGDSHPINADGVQPISRLTLAPNGDLYGTTLYGGVNGTGVIYRMHPDGGGYTVIFNFDVSPPLDTTTGALQTNATGAYPAAGLTVGSDGLLYGTTQFQGPNGYGTIYRIALDGGNFTVVQALNLTTGANPAGELMLANDGTIVGTTSAGAMLSDGTAGAGTLFSLNTAGATALDTLYVFGGLTAGAIPGTGVVQASDGSYYGTTSQGSPYGLGTVYKYGASTNNAVPQGNPPPIRNGGAIEWQLSVLLMLTAIARLLQRRRLAAKLQP